MGLVRGVREVAIDEEVEKVGDGANADIPYVICNLFIDEKTVGARATIRTFRHFGELLCVFDVRTVSTVCDNNNNYCTVQQQQHILLLCHKGIPAGLTTAS